VIKQFLKLSFEYNYGKKCTSVAVDI